MKAVKSLCFLLGLLLALPALSMACSCIAINFESALTLADAAYRGQVIRRLKNANQKRVYEVRVRQVYKGCNFKQSNHIIVTTGTNSAACGINLKVNETYSFTGYRSTMNDNIKNQLGKNPKKITHVFQATLCDFVTKWTDVTQADRKLLNNFDNSDCIATCDTGGDCLKNHYCDDGVCVDFDEPCPTRPVNCLASPCSVSTCISPSTCYDNYCGGCNAIFVDPTGTRVC